MREDRLKELLRSVQSGQTDLESAFHALQSLPYEDLGFAKIDHHREIRTGFPEVIFGQGKTLEQITAIASTISAQGSNVLTTRIDQGTAERLKLQFPRGEFFPEARLFFIRNHPVVPNGQTVLVASGGTSDHGVAEEASLTAEVFGNTVERLYDVGVAGIHRLLAQAHRLQEAQVVVVVAGMEGALASVVAGLTDAPVIAVPTSVGYGSHFGGMTPLLSMLNSCASGLGVVNIDNGFGAGYLASSITRQIHKGENRTATGGFPST